MYHAQRSPVCADILSMRKMDKVAGTFISGYVLGHNSDGRIHASFNQLRSERSIDSDDRGSGTVTGRYSSTEPNLQNIPVRDPEWGPIMRGLFMAEDGETLYSMDYSSQEPRLAVHFAALAEMKGIKGLRNNKGELIRVQGAIDARDAYRKNPRLDYHQFVADLCRIDRKDAKTLNLGLSYGMRGGKLARSLGLPTKWMIPVQWVEIDEATAKARKRRGEPAVLVAGDEARGIIDAWKRGVPFIPGLFDLTEAVAKQRGYIRTLKSRRCRFKRIAGEHDRTHAAMSRLCQSSAADQTKQGMLDLWEAGIAPSLTVHDELVISLANPGVAIDIARTMENAIPLEVPVIVDVKRGKNWGQMERMEA